MFVMFSANRCYPRSLAHLQIAFTEQINPSNPFPEILQQLFRVQNQVSAIRASSSYDILPVTQSYRLRL